MHAGNAEMESVKARIVAFLPRLRRFCMVLSRSEDRGDDLMQATVERALTRIDQWQPGTSLESWMFRIAQNIHIDEARASARRGTSIDIDEAVSIAGDDGRAIVEGRSDLERAKMAMATLPDDQRALMALVVLDGRTYKEAAEILDIPIGTVMSRIARARQSIDRALYGERQDNG
ncbi:RNA polymerase sigma factor [Sphingorhabdus pulchriflava]|uniref:RNA polymerase sigma factor n=1 Tax=Sphingorhabdus pulchriflava TaxID=2292257 RepID=A0A371B500_9SPHN|nr:RNA polymerase sigma factor [Sphingorhabdus pulchriflava]RDV02624.1 RNA polymerase sigma factor [Sphingorhabdus pulchriflava]